LRHLDIICNFLPSTQFWQHLVFSNFIIKKLVNFHSQFKMLILRSLKVCVLMVEGSLLMTSFMVKKPSYKVVNPAFPPLCHYSKLGQIGCIKDVIDNFEIYIACNEWEGATSIKGPQLGGGWCAGFRICSHHIPMCSHQMPFDYSTNSPLGVYIFNNYPNYKFMTFKYIKLIAFKAKIICILSSLKHHLVNTIFIWNNMVPIHES